MWHDAHELAAVISGTTLVLNESSALQPPVVPEPLPEPLPDMSLYLSTALNWICICAVGLNPTNAAVPPSSEVLVQGVAGAVVQGARSSATSKKRSMVSGIGSGFAFCAVGFGHDTNSGCSM